MRKSMKQFFQKSLCGILSAAMLLSGLSIPELTAYAAEADAVGDVEITEQSNNEVVSPGELEQTPDETDVTDPDLSGNSENSSGGGYEGDEPIASEDAEEGQQTQEGNENIMPVSGNEITFSYYVGDVSEEVALYYWGALTIGSGSEAASWKISGWKDTLYLMKAESTPGWYSINITITGDAGLRVYTKSGAESGDTNYLFICDNYDDHATDIYAKLTALESGSICIKDGATYSSIAEAEGGEELEETTKDYNKTVSLNYYYGDLDHNATEELGFYKWGDGITGLGADNTTLSWGGWDKPSENPVYAMTKVDGHSGWFNVEYTADETITYKGSQPIKSKSGFSIFTSKEKNDPLVDNCSGYPIEEKDGVSVNHYSDIYTGLLEGTITAIMFDKAGTLHGYATIEEAEKNREPEESTEPTEGRKWTFDELKTLIEEAEKYNEDDYTVASWKAFASALSEAKKITSESSEADIIAAYEKLGIAKNTLAEGTVSVAKLALADDFITGADISSYYSLRQSGVVFKDDEGNELDDVGFFKYLNEGGTNWVRIRVWNNPFTNDGKGYGGGNNDINAAKEIGQWATAAGIRVLIDFHYSDFWADPGKQKVPKAWTGYTLEQKVEAIETYTKESLQTLKNAGVDVGMVQVGNETTNSICGVTLSNWSESSQIFNAGSKGVRAVYPDALVAIHFTNPERSGNYANFAKNLNTYNVDYDVFASSYYPFWHGTLENLTTQLSNIAKTYNKKVMVAETSWAYTLADQDGHDNTVRKGQNDKGQSYDFSVQGQADELRAVIKAVNDVNDTAKGMGIGVFYWESAWNSKNYVYRADLSVNSDLLKENQELWEEKGCGWAAKYSEEYDPDDAGKWHGGSAVDNQSWFDAFCNALPTAKVYRYIRTGETMGEREIKSVDKNPSINIKVGEQLTYPKVTVKFNDETQADYAVNWNAEDQAKVDTSKKGTYEVKGTVSCQYTLLDGVTTKTEEFEVLLTITVAKEQGTNILTNPGFEDGKIDPWVVTQKENFGANAKVSNASSSNFHSGKWSLHFYNGSTNIGFTATQKVTGLKAGEYTFGGYLCGTDNNGNGEVQSVYVEIYGSDDQLKDTIEEKFALPGNNDWSNPEVTGIQVSEGDYLVVGVSVEAAKSAWGDVDDLYLYADSTVETPSDETKEYKNVTVNLNYYVGDVESDETVGFYFWGSGIKTDTAKNPKLDWYGWDNSKNLVYKMDPVEGHPGWFNITFTANEKIVINAGDPSKNSSLSGFSVFRSTQNKTPLVVDCSGYAEKNPEVYIGLLDGTITAVMSEGDGVVGYATIESTGKPADKTELDSLIAEYNDIKQGDYTAESWKAFIDALVAAKEVSKKADATQDEIGEAKTALEAAYKGLKTSTPVPADKTVLDKLISKYDGVTQGDYTDASWEAFKEALAAAKEVSEKADATQSEIDAAKAALEVAHDGLKKQADKAVLNSLITECEKEERGDYTEASWQTFVDALAAAKEAAENKNATQEEVDAARTALEEAYLGLDSPTGNKVNKLLLNSLITVCDAVTKDGYTEASWQTFANALATAKKVSENVDATQEEVDAARTALNEAYSGLKILADKTDLNDLIAEYEQVNQGKYTDASWKVFTDALEAAKEVAGNADASQEEADAAKAALEAAFTGLEEETVASVNKTDLKKLIDELREVKQGIYSEESWQTFKDALDEAQEVYDKADATQTEVNKAKETLEAAYNGLTKEGLWAEWTEDWENLFEGDEEGNDTISYTGGAIKPTVNVYDGETELVLKRDYTISYKNNKKLSKTGTAEVVVKGKGNYSGSVTKAFKIVEKNLNDADVIIPNLYAMAPANGKPVTLKPVVTVGKTKLKQNRDYTVAPAQEAGGIAAGSHDVIVTGTGNYIGERTITLTLADTSANEILMSSVSISKISNQTYTGSAIEPTVTVKYKGKELIENTDYGVDYDNNTEIGTATVTVKGIENGKFIGEKTTTFKIVGTALAAKKVTLKDVPNSGMVYTGEAIEPKVEVKAVGTDGEVLLTEDEDYTVEFSNNTNVGKATVTVKGMRAYSGTIKKTFKIVACDINTAEEFACGESLSESIPYAKGGSRPDGNDIFGEDTSLVLNKDYTLSYSNNKKLGENTATVKIKGKGNYKGTKSVKFTIVAQSIDSEDLTITAADVLVKDAIKGKYAVVPVITDVDGKTLKNKTDFEITGYKKSEVEITKDNCKDLVAKDEITVTVKGKGCYAGSEEATAEAEFRIIADTNSLSKASVKVDPQIYTGDEVEPKGTAVKVTIKGKEGELEEGTDYEIVSYSNNINKGTKAKLTIKGINEYGGTKTQTFKINAKPMSWAEIAARAASWLNEVFH